MKILNSMSSRFGILSIFNQSVLVAVITAQKVSVFGVILVRIFPAFSCIRTEYGEIIISPYSVRMLENAGKMRTRITPKTDTFYAVNAANLRCGNNTDLLYSQQET